MNDYKYDRVKTQASQDDERASLAAKVAAFEAAWGPVTLTPIRIGEPPKPAFRITDPDKPKAKPVARIKPARVAGSKPAKAVPPEVAEARRAARERDKRIVRAVWS